MTDERQSVGRLLRRASTWTDPEAPAAGDGWREAVLMTVAEAAEVDAATRPAATEYDASPLRPRHLLMLSPVGAALFGLGWWVGRGGVSAEEIAAVPVAVWLACAAVVVGASLAWRGLPRLWFDRGR